MKIVICDDREFELEILRTMCEEYAAENSLEADIVCTADAACIEAEQPDILILDIEMPQKSGIEIIYRRYGGGKKQQYTYDKRRQGIYGD